MIRILDEYESAISRMYNSDYGNKVDNAIAKYSASGHMFEIAGVWKDALKKYPNDKPMTLYRGLNFDTKKSYDEFIATIESGKVELGSVSSWSPDKGTAEQFSMTKPQYNEFMDPEKMSLISAQSKENERITGYRGVILSTQIQPGQGIDFSKAARHAEDEVVLPPGKYDIEIEDVLTYKDMIESSDIDEKMLSLTKDDLSINRRHSLFDYLDSHYKPEDFSDEARDHIYELTIPKEFKYKVVVEEPDESWNRDGEIRVAYYYVDQVYLKYYSKAQRAAYYKKLRPILMKILDEVEIAYDPDYTIKWGAATPNVFEACGLLDKYKQMLQRTVGETYRNLLDARAINKLPPEERKKAYDIYKSRLSKAMISMGNKEGGLVRL